MTTSITDNFKWLQYENKDYQRLYCTLCGKEIEEKHWFLGHYRDAELSNYFFCQQCTAAIATMQNLKADHVRADL